jgi:hypothetical protein
MREDREPEPLPDPRPRHGATRNETPDYTRSTSVAIPIPRPMHIVDKPIVLS